MNDCVLFLIPKPMSSSLATLSTLLTLWTTLHQRYISQIVEDMISAVFIFFSLKHILLLPREIIVDSRSAGTLSRDPSNPGGHEERSKGRPICGRSTQDDPLCHDSRGKEATTFGSFFFFLFFLACSLTFYVVFSMRVRLRVWRKRLEHEIIWSAVR